LGQASGPGVPADADRQIATATEEILTPGRQQLVLLQQEWGHWEYDSTTNAVHFHDPRIDARFRRHAADFNAAQGRLGVLLRRLNVQPPHP
jgi:hypothetical protein